MGKEKNPLFKGKARRESKINIKNTFPADGTLRLGLLFHLKLGLGRVPLNYRSIIINNKINGFSCRRERKEKKAKKGGYREEEIKDSHSTP